MNEITIPHPQLLFADDWQDYALLDSGNGQKLERFGSFTFVRPEPQAMWTPRRRETDCQAADGRFVASQGRGDDDEEAGLLAAGATDRENDVVPGAGVTAALKTALEGRFADAADAIVQLPHEEQQLPLVRRLLDRVARCVDADGYVEFAFYVNPREAVRWNEF